MIPVVYSRATGRIRRWAVPTDGETFEQLVTAVAVGRGEAIVVLDTDQMTLDEMQAQVTKQTGVEPQDDRFALVDALGNVVNVIRADLAIDTPPKGYSLVADDRAEPGWRDVAGVFVEPVQLDALK